VNVLAGIPPAALEENKMNVMVIGATGGSGRAALEALVQQGHQVTAFVRRPEALGSAAAQVTVVQGDVLERAELDRVMVGIEAVIVTLGISENPLAVRLRGSVKTPIDVRSRGTKNVIEAMQRASVRRLVLQSTYGVGSTRGRLPLKWRIIFSALLKPQIADTEVQEAWVRASGLDWVLVQPVGLTDGAPEVAFASAEGETQVMSISRRSVGKFLAAAIEDPTLIGKSVALSTRA
jgi:uncharacterized protein YbjT (DUF2867 family)